MSICNALECSAILLPDASRMSCLHGFRGNDQPTPAHIHPCVCVCVCVCEREREREHVFVLCTCVCVSMRKHVRACASSRRSGSWVTRCPGRSPWLLTDSLTSGLGLAPRLSGLAPFQGRAPPDSTGGSNDAIRSCTVAARPAVVTEWRSAHLPLGADKAPVQFLKL